MHIRVRSEDRSVAGDLLAVQVVLECMGLQAGSRGAAG